MQNLQSEGPKTLVLMFSAHLEALVPIFLRLNKLCQAISYHVETEVGRQSFAPKRTVIGVDLLLEIPRNHLVGFD